MSDCINNVRHYWELGLPENLDRHAIYFIRTENGVLTYVTDANEVPYLVGSSSGSVTLTSPDGSVSIVQNGEVTELQVAQEVLDSIISLHNDFPDLQGGTWHLTEDQHTRVLQLIYEGITIDYFVAPATGEKGVSAPVTLTYNIDSNDDTVITATINNGVGSILSGVDMGEQQVSGGNRSVSTTFTLEVDYERDGVQMSESESVTYNAYSPQWGGLSESAILDTVNYSGLNSALTKVVQNTDTISRDLAPDNEYIWFVSTNPNAVITNNGFITIIGEWNSITALFIKKTVTLTLADGVTTTSVTFYRTREALDHSTQNYTIT